MASEEIGEKLTLEPVRIEPRDVAAKKSFHQFHKQIPVLSWSLIIIAYYLIPNYINLVATNIYPSILGITLAVYVVLLAFSFRNIRIDHVLQEKAPLLVGVSLVFILWDLLTLKTAKLPMPYFPWPDKIINALISDRAILGKSFLYSLRLLAIGYAVGSIVGLISGVLVGWNRRWSYWLTPVIKIIGPIPAVTWIPLVMVLFPTSFMGSVFLISLAVWFPVTLMTSSGITNVKNAYFEVARTLGADERYLIFHVAIPAALPNVFLGLFQGMGVACATLIVAEMVGVKAGLGWYITWATGWAEYDKVYSSIFLLFLLFSGVITLLFRVRDRVLSWQKGVIRW